MTRAAEDGFGFFVTRDADNAETTRGLLASAYPEIPSTRYTVLPVEDFLALNRRGEASRGAVWPTITAAPLLRNAVSSDRLELIHPVLADDFIEELRCLALLG